MSLPTHTNLDCSVYFYLQILFFFFFNDTATTEIYTLSLHDALPISYRAHAADLTRRGVTPVAWLADLARLPEWLATQFDGDRKSTRLNSSHLVISYAVFCLKKKKNMPHTVPPIGIEYIRIYAGLATV